MTYDTERYYSDELLRSDSIEEFNRQCAKSGVRRKPKAKKVWHVDPRYTKEEIQHFEQQMIARLRDGKEGF